MANYYQMKPLLLAFNNQRNNSLNLISWNAAGIKNKINHHSNTFFLTETRYIGLTRNPSQPETDSSSPTTRPIEQTDSPIEEVEQQFSSEIQ
ncbi:hypothetical protein AVEN_220627-1 [Araneus ventricosus]|uniref:Uncharacterized protein n=1 Tax=Araneus ventricosus TaxID=182803 RepID=A0A4Y2V555_ARAVE|nr:hypothetical protein AVEN_220627-1 [Araneus ventricosus]